MLRVLQLSDLHLEFHRRDPSNWQAFITSLDPDVDVVALCGDIGVGPGHLTKVLTAFAAHFDPAPVLYIGGNHDYWHSSFDELHTRLQQLNTALPNLHWLNGDVYTHPTGQRFLGHTLWFRDHTDIYDYGWPDLEYITNGHQSITGAATQARAFFEDNLQTGDVVLTHMMPSPQCVTPRWRSYPTTPLFFVHDLHDLILERKPQLWMSGHTHDSFDVTIGATRMCCNPRGYWPNALNPNFNPNLAHTLQEFTP